MPRSSMRPGACGCGSWATARSSCPAGSPPRPSHRSARRWTPAEDTEMRRPFSRLAIVNRGEAAMRVIHAVRELNEQRGEPIIRLIALHIELERDAMFVRHADEALCLDPSPIAEGDGVPRSPYLDLSTLERALGAAGADAA